MTIDYKNLNDRIVAQAQSAAKTYHVLDDNQKQQLFQNKIERATAMIQARDPAIYFEIED